MFFLVEGSRIQVAKDTPSWNDCCHQLAKDVRDDCQEDDGDINSLWLEVEDLLENSTKDR